MTNYVPPREQSETDLGWIDCALLLAQDALDANEVPVGCVFVRNGVELASARNRTNEFCNATRHAELEAIDAMLANPTLRETLDPDLPLRGITLYVTVEPCIMCSAALRQLGIEKVYCGCLNERFGGCGGVIGVNSKLLHPRLKPYPCLHGYRREQAILILRKFYVTENANAPTPQSKATRVLKTHVVDLIS